MSGGNVILVSYHPALPSGGAPTYNLSHPNTMRILAISELLPREREPTFGIFVGRLLKEMIRQGATTTVLVPTVWCPRLLSRMKRWRRLRNLEKLAPTEFPAIAIACVRFPGNWFNRWWGSLVYFRIRKLAARLHRAQPFDVIYAVGFFPSGDAAARLSKLLGIPAVCVGAGTDVNTTSRSTPALSEHFFRVARRLAGHIARGESVALRIDEATGRKSRVIYGMVDFTYFFPAGPAERRRIRAELNLPLEKQIFLFAGHLIPTKGVHELLDAFLQTHAKRPNTFLVLCGHGPEREKLEAKASTVSSVYFAGEVPPEEISRWLRAADVFTLPSYMEGMPNAVMEAMACGLPVVTTKVGGIPAALGQCEGAILIPPKEVTSLAQTLTGLASDPTRVAQMAEAALQKARLDFGIENSGKKTLAYLSDVIEAFAPSSQARPGAAK